MPAQTQKTINLLFQNDFEHSTIGKLLQWLLSAGRTIVILTELVVIIAFLSRFWLDKTLTDLSETNESKRVQLEASLPFEQDFKSVQTRINLIKQLGQDNVKSSSIITTVVQLIPSDISLANIAVSDKKITIQGSALSEASLSGFLNSLESSKKFTNISLSDIALENRVRQTIKFTLKSDLVKGVEK